MLRLLTFGGLSLVDDGAPVTGAASQRSRLALLALLAAAGPAGMAREKVLACLWPESEDERARHALKQAVYALRRDLGSEHAISGTATLCLDANLIASDIREFEDALARGDDAAAVAAYTGPFLDGVFVRGSSEFDQWAGVERARLERSYLDAVARLARGAEKSGDMVGAVQWWRRSAAAEPLSGRIALCLMRALADSGDVTAAMQHARVHDAMVRAELESPADDAVLSFAEELRRGDYTPPVRTSGPVVEVAPRISVPQPVAAFEEPAAPIAHTPSVPVPAAAPARRRMPLALTAAGLVVLLGVAVGGVLLKDQVASLFGASDAATSSRRIVVAALRNQTGDTSKNVAGEMAADFIVQRLVEAEFEVVDSRTAALASRAVALRGGTANDRAAALAKETGAGMVVMGNYYQHGDTLQFDASVLDPARNVTLYSVRPVMGHTSSVQRLVESLANQLAASLAGSRDTMPGASATSLIQAPSVAAFAHASRGWAMFFSTPAETTAVFAEFARAVALDSAYTTPRLMRAYVLDVKEKWADLAAAVDELDSRRSRMGRVELAALALFEADLRGDFEGRLRASRELHRLSPGSVDMALLVAISASYLHRPNEVLQVLDNSHPDRGINLLTPMYWAWRATAEHSLGRFDEEQKSAQEMVKRFPAQLYGAQALSRSLAARGDTVRLDSLIRSVGLSAGGMTPEARTVGLLGARELRAHGRAAPAKALFARVASMPPDARATRDAHAKHALALYETGDYAKARSAYAALVASEPRDMDAIGRLGAIAARTGDAAAVRATDEMLAAWSDKYAFGRNIYWRAHLAALTGRGSEAIVLLHSAIQKGFRAMDLNIVTLHEEPDFMSIWSHPGFHEIVRPHVDRSLPR